MSTETVEQLREGNIYSWRYTPEAEASIRNFHHDAYWCKSRIAVIRKGHLVDTYWSSPDTTLDPAKVILTFLGNPADMEKIFPGERVFYRDEDIVNMQHSNNSGAEVYAKAGRDAETMKAYFAYQIEKTEREIRWAHQRIQECNDAIARVGRGEIASSFSVYN